MTVKIVGYKESVLAKLGLTTQPLLDSSTVRLAEEDEEIDDRLSSMVDLILVDDVKIIHGDESLFNHPQNKVWLHASLSFSYLNAGWVYVVISFNHLVVYLLQDLST